jgi:hypothetical protein
MKSSSVRTSAAETAFAKKHINSNPKAIVKETLLKFIVILLFIVCRFPALLKSLKHFNLYLCSES